MMDWTYPETNDEAGIFEIGRRLAEELGRAPDVTRFIWAKAVFETYER